MALKSDGTVIGWGDNSTGQVSVPAGLSDIVAISTGDQYTVALRSDGKVFAWGANFSGQASVPAGLSSIVAIAAGRSHTLALRSDGTVIGWGDSRFGQLTFPADLTNGLAIAVTETTSIVLRGDGTVRTFGDNSSYHLPMYISGVVAIASGFEGGTRQTVALRSDGTLYFLYWAETPLNLMATAIDIAAYAHIALKGDATVEAWTPGADIYNITKIPPRLRNVVAIAAGETHMLAVQLPSPPVPATARATPQRANGFIIGLNVIDGGEGYDEPPKVTIIGGGGSGAVATAQITKGIVTGFTITNAGINYSSDPEVTIDPPDYLPKIAIAPSRVNVTMQVVPGKRYQLESSNDLPNFSAVGQPFTATAPTHTQEFTLSETGQYFRIQEVP